MFVISNTEDRKSAQQLTSQWTLDRKKYALAALFVAFFKRKIENIGSQGSDSYYWKPALIKCNTYHFPRLNCIALSESPIQPRIRHFSDVDNHPGFQRHIHLKMGAWRTLTVTEKMIFSVTSASQKIVPPKKKNILLSTYSTIQWNLLMMAMPQTKPFIEPHPMLGFKKL